MIVVKLMGGLGNQMFQYAAAKALALKHNVPVFVDTSFLNRDANNAYTKRELELTVFALEINTADVSVLSKFKLPKSKWERAFRRLFAVFFSHRYYSERGFAYQHQFDTLPASCYMEGFWQNERYFKSIRKQLLQDFLPKENKPIEIKNWADKISNCRSLALHVRRGDYVQSPDAAAYHGNLPISYYTAAIDHIKKFEANFTLFIFSDDINWCKQHFSEYANCNFVEHTQHAVWDLVLMSLCNHNIIANSSFSWWGAWLNQQQNKKVIMPKQWLAKQSSAELGIVPEDWITL